MTARRVWLTGTFDVLNYGDLLFPLIAAHRLAPHGIEIIPIAPTAHWPPWQDAAAPLGVRDMLAGKCRRMPSHGRGYIVHTQSLGFLEEYQEDEVGETAGAQLGWVPRSPPACMTCPWRGTRLACSARSRRPSAIPSSPERSPRRTMFRCAMRAAPSSGRRGRRFGAGRA